MTHFNIISTDTITNVATNQTITYIQEGQNWFPSDDDDNAAITTFYQNPTGPYMRLSSNGQLQKCVSAQWGYDEAGPGIGADHAGVLCEFRFLSFVRKQG